MSEHPTKIRRTDPDAQREYLSSLMRHVGIARNQLYIARTDIDLVNRGDIGLPILQDIDSALRRCDNLTMWAAEEFARLHP